MQVLYQLSYVGSFQLLRQTLHEIIHAKPLERETRLELATLSLEG